MRKILLLISMLSFSFIFTACDKDDDNDENFLVKIVNGDVISTQKLLQNAVSLTLEDKFSFQDGNLSSYVQKILFPNELSASTMLPFIESAFSDRDIVDAIKQEGKTVVVDYTTDYLMDEFGQYVSTAEELKSLLELRGPISSLFEE